MCIRDRDATTALQPGENRLALKVRSESLADMLGSLTQYAAHQLGGITRKVTLFAVPDVHISDLRIVTELDEQYKDAELKVYLAVTNAGKETEKNIAARLSIGGLPVVCLLYTSYWWVFPVAFVIVSAITFITVTYQNWQVANSNPVESIKSE